MQAGYDCVCLVLCSGHFFLSIAKTTGVQMKQGSTCTIGAFLALQALSTSRYRRAGIDRGHPRRRDIQVARLAPPSGFGRPAGMVEAKSRSAMAKYLGNHCNQESGKRKFRCLAYFSQPMRMDGRPGKGRWALAARKLGRGLAKLGG